MAYSEALKTSTRLTQSAASYRSLVNLTTNRYAKGLISLTDLLDIQRQYNNAERLLLDSDTSAMDHLITLYKALGGGWQPCN